MDLEEPVLHDRPWLLFTAEKKDLERAWQAIKARVGATNLAYAREVVPAREAARRRERATADVAAEAVRTRSGSSTTSNDRDRVALSVGRLTV
jgi:hypothetical protein